MSAAPHFEQALSAARERYNQQFKLAQASRPNLDPQAFGSSLREWVAPLVEAVAKNDAARVEIVTAELVEEVCERILARIGECERQGAEGPDCTAEVEQKQRALDLRTKELQQARDEVARLRSGAARQREREERLVHDLDAERERGARLRAEIEALQLRLDRERSADGGARAAAAAEHDSWLMVDEAHALGVLGPDGAGSAAAVGLDARQVPILMGTFGKALGGWGAFIAGSVELIEHLQHTARPWLFSTALPAAWATLCRSAVARVRRETALREQLQARIAQFRDGAAELGLSRPPLASNDSGDERIGLLPSDTPIQPFLLGSEARALTWEAALADAGLAVKAIRPPTVPAGQSRLRIALSAGHSPEQIERLLGALARLRDSEAQT